ncbi:MAG: 4-hydroxythreonine-4-phosphate dehydrogenase PdxA, partial [Bacteroidia bacterium]|nr:4-hydroxythreonine-4-phosphate dehydrogenase PdxA [Bacteroidia bacterium]
MTDTETTEVQEIPPILVGITMGDVNGIGPELVMKLFEDPRILRFFTPVIYGSGKAIYFYKNMLGYRWFLYQQISDPRQAQPGKVNFIECTPNFEKVEVGKPTPASGYASYLMLNRAVNHIKENKLSILVTLPINKSTIQSEQFQFPGHTEFLAKSFDVTENLMLMVHENLRIAVVRGHDALKDTAGLITTNRVYNKLLLLNHSLKQDFGIEKPKIAVLALNPHAGDNGLIGTEEKEVIKPAI